MRRSHWNVTTDLAIFVFVLAALCGCQNQPANLVPANPQIDFGDVLVGTTSAPQMVSWDNTGGDKATIFALPITNAVFKYGGTVNFQSADIAAGGTSPQWPIVFQPTALGAQAGEVDPNAFNPSGTNRPQTTPVALKGNGVAQISTGDLSVIGGAITPGQILDFDNVQVNTTSAALAFTVRNSSATKTHVVSVQWANGGQGFVVTAPGQQFAIPPGSAIAVALTFTPAAVGNAADGVRFVVVGGTGAHEAATAVKGKGIPAGGG